MPTPSNPPTTTTPRALTIKTAHRNYAAQVWGPDDGPPVLAIHGWLDNANSFARLAPFLPTHRIVAIDLPGHGLSDHIPPGTAYHFVDSIADIDAVTRALHWDRCTLLGHSLGAGIAPIFAGTFPDRVDALVLLDGLGPLTDLPEQAPERLAKSLTRQLKHQPARQRLLGNLEDATQRMFLARQDIAVESARILAERGTKPVDDNLTWTADARLHWPSRLRMSEAQVRVFLQRIRCPILLVHANEGYAEARQSMAERVKILDNIEVVGLAGGHHVHLDAPELVGPHVRDFLQRLR